MSTSEKTLAEKLGIKKAMKLLIIGCPYDYREPCNLSETSDISDDQDIKYAFIHLFCNNAEDYEMQLMCLKFNMLEDGMIWVSWLKQTSPDFVNLNKNVIRSVALANGLVDVKICSINEHWTAMKLVIPVKDRNKLKKKQ